MKWYAITNRNLKRGRFKREPEPYGNIHFLEATADMPEPNEYLELDHFGDSDDDDAKRVFLNRLRSELKSRAKRLRDAGEEQKPTLLLYLHGYNNDYDDAVEEYVELRRNFHAHVGRQAFERQCLLVLFTWPSAGKVVAYLEDRDDARGSALAVKHMVHLLFEVTNELTDCISNVSVIAHSMGNYVLREALTSIAGSPHAPAGTFIDQFLMIGADVSNTSLEPGGKGFGITRFSNRVSVYYTPADSTLSKSKRKNGRPRLGRTLSSDYIETPDNVVFIDCRLWANGDKIDEIFPNDTPSVHSSYRSIPAIIGDMFNVLRGVDREMFPARKTLVLNKLYLLTDQKFEQDVDAHVTGAKI